VDAENLANELLAEALLTSYLKTKLDLIEAVERDDLTEAAGLLATLITIRYGAK
jgi:hypothetical protein